MSYFDDTNKMWDFLDKVLPNPRVDELTADQEELLEEQGLEDWREGK